MRHTRCKKRQKLKINVTSFKARFSRKKGRKFSFFETKQQKLFLTISFIYSSEYTYHDKYGLHNGCSNLAYLAENPSNQTRLVFRAEPSSAQLLQSCLQRQVKLIFSFGFFMSTKGIWWWPMLRTLGHLDNIGCMATSPLSRHQPRFPSVTK